MILLIKFLVIWHFIGLVAFSVYAANRAERQKCAATGNATADPKEGR